MNLRVSSISIEYKATGLGEDMLGGRTIGEKDQEQALKSSDLQRLGRGGGVGKVAENSGKCPRHKSQEERMFQERAGGGWLCQT